jgi:cell division septation protein DedD
LALLENIGERRTIPTETPQNVEERMLPLPQVAEEKVVPPPQTVEEKIVPSLSPIISTEGKCIVSYDAKRNGYVLQIVSCVTLKKANSVAQKVNNISGLMTFVKAVDIPSIGRRYRVFIGDFKTREEAVAFCLQFNFDL